MEREARELSARASSVPGDVEQLKKGLLPSDAVDKLKQQYPREIRNAPMLGIRYYSFQTQSPAFKDVRVRKALSMVIDRDILADKITADGQAPAYGLIVKGMEGANMTEYEWAHWPMAKKVAGSRSEANSSHSRAKATTGTACAARSGREPEESPWIAA